MPEPSREALAARIEVAVRRAREEISRANYPSALAALEQALRLAPGDGELRRMLEETSKAALRHEAAVERNRAVAQAAQRVTALLDRGDLDAAGTELREANLRFGKHSTLLGLQERFDTLWREAELEKTVAHVDQARAFLDGKNWRSALQQAERVLRLDPRNREALVVKERARAEIERQEARRQALLEIEQAQQDVERLIRADELPQATRALSDAVDRLGRHEVFDELARRVEEAKAELQVRKRLEWTQRRFKEAEDLLRQAGRLSLQGKHEEAVERLNAARELHPEHPEIEDMLQAAETARERSVAEHRRAEALETSRREIRQLLDALRLDEAERRLRAAEARFGEDEGERPAGESEEKEAPLPSLRLRLARLREAESTGAELEAGAELDRRQEAAALAHQQELAAAYSWKQTLLYPFRGDAVAVFWCLVALVVVLEALDALPWVGGVFRVLRWLVPVAVLGWQLAIVRETLHGKNMLPPWSQLSDVRHRALDLALVLGVVLLAVLPLGLIAVTRGWHGLFASGLFASASGGTVLGWWLAALLGWCAAALVVLAGGAAAAFGHRRAWSFARHVRALLAGEPDTLLAVNLAFGLVAAWVVLRATFLPFIPWLGSPLAGAIEAYALLAVPHLIGVVVRRHRIELARIYR